MAIRVAIHPTAAQNPQLLAQGRTGGALHQLAARSFRQFPGAPGLSRTNQTTEIHRRSDCGHGLHQSLRFPMIQQHTDLAHYAAAFFPDDRPFLSAVMELTEKIYTDFTYDPRFSDVATPLSDVLKHKRGVCQDFAHFAIGCLRSLGYPARYVSGYLETLPPPGQEKLVGADATHAWFEVFSPGEGWFEFDPTNNKMAGEQHITTAWGRDYSDVTPLKGVIFGDGKQHTLSVSVDVQRLAD